VSSQIIIILILILILILIIGVVVVVVVVVVAVVVVVVVVVVVNFICSSYSLWVSHAGHYPEPTGTRRHCTICGT
jgi:hypothetical protein